MITRKIHFNHQYKASIISSRNLQILFKLLKLLTSEVCTSTGFLGSEISINRPFLSFYLLFQAKKLVGKFRSRVSLNFVRSAPSRYQQPHINPAFTQYLITYQKMGLIHIQLLHILLRKFSYENSVINPFNPSP